MRSGRAPARTIVAMTSGHHAPHPRRPGTRRLARLRVAPRRAPTAAVCGVRTGRSPTRSACAAIRGSAGRSACRARFEDPAGMRQASLLAGGFLLLVGIGALALVRPWGLRLPRWLVIVPALAGSVFAMAHALTAYVTKPLHLLGVIDIQLPRLGPRRRGGADRLGPRVLRAVVPGARDPGHARHAAPPPPHRRLGRRGAPAGRGGRGRHGGAHRGRVGDGGDVSAGRRLAAS